MGFRSKYVQSTFHTVEIWRNLCLTDNTMRQANGNVQFRLVSCGQLYAIYDNPRGAA